ncbi:acyl transferase/acyl hydrolase/lysophospholipase [Fusarium solani]|uniref:Acyl transferase/acyl hydrolase/lysophospholipase n=1 Tax=Fusarium solani TaxID=169388 RepID=A0A9P9JRY7_FUSSL|nr:acyl transferase/acyl hydrolase/lysophospholipase [Fusarium solani]KAH7229950.1 acyl transferase/acyl hydrolase/lysophospholipase [Fusarium solani]
MSRCRHTCWLKPWVRGPESGLNVTDRPQRILRDFDDPDVDTTGVLMLVGNQSKQAAFRKLLFQNEPVRARASGEVHLLVSSFRECRQRPFVIADTDIPKSQSRPSSPRGRLCHEVTVHTFMENSMPSEVSEIHDHLFHKALLPFADVICVFVEDIGGFQASLRRVIAWLEKGPPSKSPVRPRILLVANQEDMQQHRIELERCLETHHFRDLNDSFSGVSIVGVPRLSSKRRSRRCRLTRRWQVLGPEILRALETSRQSRRRSNYLFSVRHLAEFLQHGANAARNLAYEPFDFIKTSRVHRDVAPDLSRHISNFLEKFTSLSSLKQFAVPLIASSLLIDHYPPGMHLFDPHDVFRELYEDACSRASSEFKPGYKGCFAPSEIFQALGASLDWHRQQLARISTFLASVYSNETCLGCITRRPQYRLQCGHLVCQNCIRTFYHADDSDPWVFKSDACHICAVSTPNLSIRLAPNTCRARVLSIDGGGIRGAAPIGFLKTIQDAIGIPHYDVQRNFDIMFGTSSGGLSVISLDILGWSVDDCMSHLKRFAGKAFDTRGSHILRLLSRIPVISSVTRLFCFIYAVLVDRKYPADGLEELLMNTYGRERSITDVSAATEMGSQVGITLTNALDDYCHLSSDDGHQQVKWWEVYFKPRRIGDLGTFQDGGLAFNNPASIAIREAIALSPDAAEPSIVVSLGTGSSSSNPEGESSSILVDKFPFRLSRALWRQTSSKTAWNHLLGHQKAGDRTNFFRFDIEFEEKEPLLDDVNKMEHVRQTACQTMTGSPSLHRLSRHLRAELFFFELDDSLPPYYSNGAYQCTGTISCRLRAMTLEYEAFMQQLWQKTASFRLGGQILGITCENIHANFSHKVCFSLPSPKHQFAIKLAERDGDSFDISGSPFTLDWLMQRQGLNSKFGTSDHRKRKCSSVPTRLQSKRRKFR